MPIDLLNFVRKWNASSLTERSAASQHFRDLCEVLEVSHPTQTDEIGANYTYEKRVTKAGSGEEGYADVWKRGFFAWEYKSKGGDLKKAYKQLNEYHEALDNPPLLVVCDFVRFEVHTKFENLPTRVYAFTLDDLLVDRDTATCALPPLEVLRHVFGDFNQLRPRAAAVRVTKAAASDFLRLAQRIELERAAAPERPSKEEIAHFLMRLVFCLFADSVGLLPNRTFRQLVINDRHSPISFNRKLPVLFQAMSEEGSFFGPDNIPYIAGPTTQAAKTRRAQPTLSLNRPALTLLQDWAAELTHIRILDPACGSGNFLYIALKRLLDLWHQARIFGIEHGLTLALDPIPHPGQLFGIEIDFYAHEIASIVVWIGFLQWKHDHGVKETHSPLLKALTNIEHADAILRYDADNQPYEPTWPAADYIVGNPPFLGGKLLRRELGDKYIDDLFDLYKGRVKAESDLVIYWFEKGRAQLEVGGQRVGLLATQSIRGGANRNVLDRIQQTGNIFWAWSDRQWLLQGATVHVSMIGFDLGQEPSRTLNGTEVAEINANLTSGTNAASAARLAENNGICFMGITRIGPFELDPNTARKLLASPLNPNGRPNSDVVKPWINALDITRRPRGMFIIDFGVDMPEAEAALYQLPFEHVKHHVRPNRINNRRSSYADAWWIFGEPRAAMRSALTGLSRFIATPMVSKHRIYLWQDAHVIAENLVNVIAREDDYMFGVLNSVVHETWALEMGTQLESRPRYTPNSTFDTFPFPWPPGTEPSKAESPVVKAVADAARELVRLRDGWLNPPDTPAQELKKRTLTNLYNQRPTWLDDAHRALDEAVFAAYGWPSNLTTQQILANLLALNHQRAATRPE